MRVEAALGLVAMQKRAKGQGRLRGQPDLSVQSSIGATDIMWRIRSALKLSDMGGGGMCAWAFHAALMSSGRGAGGQKRGNALDVHEFLRDVVERLDDGAIDARPRGV